MIHEDDDDNVIMKEGLQSDDSRLSSIEGKLQMLIKDEEFMLEHFF